jgi:hypothetical protein
MKIKRMPLHEFKDVLGRNGTPVRLVGDAIPEWARGIPESLLVCVCASGVVDMPENADYTSKLIRAGKLTGGIDVYRYSPDDPVDFNKDWYAVVRGDDDAQILLVDGPIKDGEHWLNSISERLRDIEILGLPKLKSEAKT